MEKKIHLFANWKMYLGDKESVLLAKKYAKLKYPKNCSVAVFPSAIAFKEVAGVLKRSKLALGAQNTFWADKGGYTGEVSATTYKELGAGFALVGHAERRHIFHETNHDTRLKIDAVLQLGLTPVLCVGETDKEHKAGETDEVLEAQLRAVFMDRVWPKNITPIIAYEPVWAIGTGASCDHKEAERVAALITGWTEKLIGVVPVILYGGSVRGENIGHYLSQKNISGVLVGGASAKLDTWTDLVTHLS